MQLCLRNSCRGSDHIDGGPVCCVYDCDCYVNATDLHHLDNWGYTAHLESQVVVVR